MGNFLYKRFFNKNLLEVKPIKIKVINMEKIQIGETTLQASRVCLGTWAMGGWLWGGTNDDVSVRTVHAALDRGINIIDTAPVYGFGKSEEIIGHVL